MDLLNEVLDEIERVAWSIPAPNPYTPQLMSLALSARTMRKHEQAKWRKHNEHNKGK